MIQTSSLPADPLEMPELYFQRTTPEEQERHRHKLAHLPPQGWLVEEVPPVNGGAWTLELVTMDWDEPGLLDRVFESILRCINIPEGVEVQRARIFTGRGGQVVNLLELESHQGRPLSESSRELVLQELRRIHRGERGVLETIQHFPFSSPVPLVTGVPSLDNGRSPDYTYLELEVERLSNRFTSVLLHFLARSELWLNIQVAEFTQGPRARYAFYVVDKHGRKLKDSQFVRHSLVRALEAMNRMLMQFNLSYVRRDWSQRIERNESTIYHSRPDPSDFLGDLRNLRQLAELKGLGQGLGSLVEHGLLSSSAYYQIKKVEAFVGHNQQRLKAMRESVPDQEQIKLCREYFEHRRRTLRVLTPLFQRLLDVPPRRPSLTDAERLHALCRPMDSQRMGLDENNQLYILGPVWVGEPHLALDPLLLMARTDCYLRGDTLEAIEAAMEGWTPYSIAEHREEIGRKMLTLVDETLRQGNAAIVLRTLRAVGLLERLIPHFAEIQGLIHVVADHSYTVDEHSFVLIEVLSGMKLLADVLPHPERPAMLADYQRTKDALALKKFANKYAQELRMLGRVTELRSNPAIRAFFQYMEEVRINSVEYLVDVNLLEHGYTTCMIALNEIEKTRKALGVLIQFMVSLPLQQQRCLLLAGLLHDLRKPALNHPELGADVLAEVLGAMGLPLSAEEQDTIGWLIRHHLDLRDVITPVDAKGEEALLDYARQVGDLHRVRLLVLFTYADRVAVHLDSNKNSHDAMLLTDLLRALDRAERAERAAHPSA